ncbi:MAG TPA: tRNA (adenosine(37)-N6)-dimethylallyltransferase MiaA [Alphaproteobacteria bacterium]|nr:tRNA (adenosine(37)-N6)-dimethylallyltransferase MiaA [Alphaproteobacteria bacterium]
MGRAARRPGLTTEGDSRRPVIAVVGPTASGKSALALDLARELGGAVINFDSMQLYRELRILTARPSPEDEAAVPHRLYGVIPAAEACSAARWRDLALEELARADDAGRLPILTGGTGLYLRALIEGLSPVPDVPRAVREETRRRFAALGDVAFHAELAASDPVMGARLNPGDKQRLIRAAEVLTATGRSLAEWQSVGGERASEESLAFYTVVLLPPRAMTRSRIAERFASMLAAGALEEVRRLSALDLSPDLPAMKAHGVPELTRHLAGELSLEEAAQQAILVTGQYAKRQVTWLRHQVKKDYVVDQQYSPMFTPVIVNKIRQFLLTLQG